MKILDVKFQDVGLPLTVDYDLEYALWKAWSFLEGNSSGAIEQRVT
jgi:hypothetical protein